MLSKESMRSDIAKVLDESEDAVGDDDNLMDLGLDSLRAMSLVTSWSGNGINFVFGDFAAAAPTLAGWWEVVSARQAGDGGTA